MFKPLFCVVVLVLVVAFSAHTADASGTRGQWASGICSALGVPGCQNNIDLFVAWMQAEGSPCDNNPLDTTLSEGSTSDCNSVGVKNYPSIGAGTKATVDTLTNGMYGGIVSNLKACSDPVTTAHAIANSPWGTGQLAVECAQNCEQSQATCNSWASKGVPGP
eukprot:a340418_489.p1 GENE.a340418_489~~a340418_489.p1  ORF type:complete len:175 (-),score=33.14 a340418_489:80-568(-)